MDMQSPNYRKSPWFQDERREQILRENFNRYSTAQLADLINRQTGSAFTRNAIIGRAHRLGLINKRPVQSGPKVKKLPHENGTGLAARLRAPRNYYDIPQVADEPELPFLNITFDDLDERHCRYLRGGDGKPFLYCGQPHKDNSSYCAFHHSICHHKLNDFRRKDLWVEHRRGVA